MTLTSSNLEKSAIHSEGRRGRGSGSDREIEHPPGKASSAAKEACDGSMTEWICVPENAEDSIRFNCELDSNEIDENDSQIEKHDFARISRFRGMQIDFNEQFEKHDSSIRVKRDSLSNISDSKFDRAK
jgi:hypothetical protein